VPSAVVQAHIVAGIEAKWGAQLKVSLYSSKRGAGSASGVFLNVYDWHEAQNLGRALEHWSLVLYA
jgi:hypothetical protein